MSELKALKSSIAPFGLRMPAEIKAMVEASAAANGRSMNAEILARLSQDVETLRDKFAGQALAGLCANMGTERFCEMSAAHMADLCFLYADAMLAERAK